MKIINVLCMLILQVACDSMLPENSALTELTKSIQHEIIMYNEHKQELFKQSKVKKYLEKLKKREETDRKAVRGQ